jgi:quercetin dioxygenase-like cupin family protein
VKWLGALFVVVLMAGSASAEIAPLPGTIRLSPQEIAKLPTLNPGPGTSGLKALHMRVLSGDPSASGPYTIALEVPPNTRIAAHTHKDDRTAIVVRGKWFFGYGPKAGAAGSRTLGPGSFYSEPARVAHFARAGAEGAVVYIAGFGPSDTQYTE